MTYNITYMTDVARTVSGIIIDSQYIIPAISNKLGIAIKAYSDTEINKITDNVIPYKVETDNGNLAGYFTLQVKEGVATLLQFQLRPAFVLGNQDISNLIGNFILSNLWSLDILN